MWERHRIDVEGKEKNFMDVTTKSRCCKGSREPYNVILLDNAAEINEKVLNYRLQVAPVR